VTDNIIDFTSRLQEKLEKVDDEIHKICTETANELINNLYEDYDLNISNVEYSPEMIFFFEAYKSLVMKSADQWHPFQELAMDFMIEQNITIEKDDDGYRFVIEGDAEDEPANDE
jgi:hypothetical protein